MYAQYRVNVSEKQVNTLKDAIRLKKVIVISVMSVMVLVCSWERIVRLRISPFWGGYCYYLFVEEMYIKAKYSQSDIASNATVHTHKAKYSPSWQVIQLHTHKAKYSPSWQVIQLHTHKAKYSPSWQVMQLYTHIKQSTLRHGK